MSQEKAKTYTVGFKGSAVKLANGTDKTAAQTARDIGINESTLPTWTGKYIRPVANVKAVRTDEHLYEELKRLKKEVAQLAEARNPLLRALGVKKAAAYLCPVGTLPRNNCEVSKGHKYAWIKQHDNEFCVHPMCRFIPPGAFMAFGYKWVFPGAPTLVGPSVNRPPAARSIAN